MNWCGCILCTCSDQHYGMFSQFQNEIISCETTRAGSHQQTCDQSEFRKRDTAIEINQILNAFTFQRYAMSPAHRKTIFTQILVKYQHKRKLKGNKNIFTKMCQSIKCMNETTKSHLLQHTFHQFCVVSSSKLAVIFKINLSDILYMNSGQIKLSTGDMEGMLHKLNCHHSSLHLIYRRATNVRRFAIIIIIRIICCHKIITFSSSIANVFQWSTSHI